MTTDNNSSGHIGVSTDKPQRGIKENYMELYYRTHDKLAQIVAESNGVSDHRIRLYTLMMISMFPDDTIRKRTYDYFYQEIGKINKDTKDVEERNQKIAEFCLGEMQGLITSHFDQFMGITHKIVIGGV